MAEELTGSGVKGAQVKLGNQAVKPDGEGRVAAKIDWQAAILGSPLEAWTTKEPGKTAPGGLGLDVVFDDGRHFAGAVDVSRPSLNVMLTKTFAKLDAGPLPVEPEGKGKALLWIPSKDMRQSASAFVIGDAKTLADVELVSISKDLPPVKKSCGLYRNTATGETGQIAAEAFELEVKTVERRTGKVRDTKKLTPAFQDCPRSMAGGGFPSLGSTVNALDVASYLKAVAGK